MLFNKSVRFVLAAVALPVALSACTDDDDNASSSASKYFNRLSSFAVCSQIDASCDTDTQTSAEIVAANSDATVLIYTDSPAHQLGFIDILSPSRPQADGTLQENNHIVLVDLSDGSIVNDFSAGTVGDSNYLVNSLNFLFTVSSSGVIEQVVPLPDAQNDVQERFGFQGVTEYNGSVYAAFQRAWSDDSDVRIGIYDTDAESWSFLFYPLDTVESQNGGWVGLSEITSLGDGVFMVVERDDQAGPDAAIKRLYSFDVSGLSDGDTVSKTLVRDLIDDLEAPGGAIPEKIEGAALLANGDVLIVNNNDGVDNTSGETQLINLSNILN